MSNQEFHKLLMDKLHSFALNYENAKGYSYKHSYKNRIHYKIDTFHENGKYKETIDCGYLDLDSDKDNYRFERWAYQYHLIKNIWL